MSFLGGLGDLGVLGALGGSPLVTVHRRARADEVPVAVWIVDPTDRGPEFMLADPPRRIRRLLARILVRPVVADHRGRGVRGMLQRVVRLVRRAGFNRA